MNDKQNKFINFVNVILINFFYKNSTTIIFVLMLNTLTFMHANKLFAQFSSCINVVIKNFIGDTTRIR